jgi:hypothetical protein
MDRENFTVTFKKEGNVSVTSSVIEDGYKMWNTNFLVSNKYLLIAFISIWDNKFFIIHGKIYFKINTYTSPNIAAWYRKLNHTIQQVKKSWHY